MPRGDKTGPTGRGSKTGKAKGYCAGYTVPGDMNPGFGYGMGMGAGRRGFGRGRRMGMGWGWRGCLGCPFCGCCFQPEDFAPPTLKDQKQMLSDYKKDLEEEMKMVDEEMENVLQSK